MSAKLDGQTVIELGGEEFLFPLPDELSYQTSYGWEKIELGIIGGQLRDVLRGGSVTNSMLTSAVEAQMRQANAFSIGDIRSQMSRTAVNPKEAVLFKGVSHREYSLAFRLADKTEAGMIGKIEDINIMQQKSAPKVQGDGIFFDYPETGTLAITEGGNYIFKPREIAVTSINVNVAPDGFYATWTGGTPLSISVSVGVIELNLPTHDNDERIIGFGG